MSFADCRELASALGAELVDERDDEEAAGSIHAAPPGSAELEAERIKCRGSLGVIELVGERFDARPQVVGRLGGLERH